MSRTASEPLYKVYFLDELPGFTTSVVTILKLNSYNLRVNYPKNKIHIYILADFILNLCNHVDTNPTQSTDELDN